MYFLIDEDRVLDEAEWHGNIASTPQSGNGKSSWSAESSDYTVTPTLRYFDYSSGTETSLDTENSSIINKSLVRNPIVVANIHNNNFTHFSEKERGSTYTNVPIDNTTHTLMNDTVVPGNRTCTLLY